MLSKLPDAINLSTPFHLGRAVQLSTKGTEFTEKIWVMEEQEKRIRPVSDKYKFDSVGV